MNRTMVFSVLMLSLSSLMITGCNQEQKAAKTSPAVVKKYTHATILEGTVSNDKGLIKNGIVAVNDEENRLITQVPVDNGHFSVEIPADTVLPILLMFSSDATAEKLVAVVIDDRVTKNYYINTSTTAIAKAAKALGGYTRANMILAAENTVHIPDKNKTTTGWRGDPTTQYGGWH